MSERPDTSSLAGVWIGDDGSAHLAWDEGPGPRRVEYQVFRPFVWAMEGVESDAGEGVSVTPLRGEGEYSRLLHFDDVVLYRDFLKEHGRSISVDWIRQLEHQYLMQSRLRLYGEMHFGELRRMQLDIETACCVEGGFSDAKRDADRVLAIGLRCGEDEKLLVLEESSAEGERKLLQQLNEAINDIDPDVIEGHNIFKFDLDYLRIRGKNLRVPCGWGRFGQIARFRSSRLRVAERWIDYPRCDLPGRAIVDTFLLAQIYDITTRELMSYGLKDVAKHLGVTSQSGEERTYIEGDQIQVMFKEDRERFLAYLSDDLRETKGVAEVLLPTYFEQARAFPTNLQDAYLRGTVSKVDLAFQEEYFHREAACPVPGETSAFAGGYTASFTEGVYQKVLHFDVASLYPSLLLLIGRNPKRDTEGVFIPMLKRLREYRLEYKKLAREATDKDLASEYAARQTSFKILINSFYGYLGFSGARFGDADLAAEVTARGRELLKKLIDFFEKKEFRLLEADTDGIYLSAEEFFDDPEPLLKEAQAILPASIELEYDGKYTSMFCYKAKNYALYDGKRVILRGSALRSRGIEPFLKRLTQVLIDFLLEAGELNPAQLASEYEERIESREIDIKEIAKSEVLSHNPEAYRKKIESGGKPRRASAEVALMIDQPLRMGDRVSYYIGPKEKGKSSDWQRAKPVEQYNRKLLPYDPAYYIKKLNDWRKRYAVFLPSLIAEPKQGDLFG